MLDEQLSKFDVRLIRFDVDNKLKIRYDISNPDLAIQRDGTFHIINEKEVTSSLNIRQMNIIVEKIGCDKRVYSLNFLMKFLHYGNCDMCYCNCQDV